MFDLSLKSSFWRLFGRGDPSFEPFGFVRVVQYAQTQIHNRSDEHLTRARGANPATDAAGRKPADKCEDNEYAKRGESSPFRKGGDIASKIVKGAARSS
jgi:hypothetical protein